MSSRSARFSFCVRSSVRLRSSMSMAVAYSGEPGSGRRPVDDNAPGTSGTAHRGAGRATRFRRALRDSPRAWILEPDDVLGMEEPTEEIAGQQIGHRESCSRGQHDWRTG